MSGETFSDAMGVQVEMNVNLRIAGLALVTSFAIVGCSGNGFSGKSASSRFGKNDSPVSPIESEDSNIKGHPQKKDDPTRSDNLQDTSVKKPVVKAVFVEVPKDTLGPEATVSVIWSPEGDEELLTDWDAVVEIKTLGSNEWAEFGRTAAKDGKISKVWGDRAIGPFESRVTLVKDDLVSNSSTSQWAPHVFSTAILTRTVQCLFCHIRVEGDVGGIDFPAAGMHEAAATGVQIMGELFATSSIPDVLKFGPQNKGAVATGATIENYKNTGKKIFPTPNQDGVVDFPKIEESSLSSRMLGRLFGRASADGAQAVEISKVHKGNLFLDGTESPFEIHGEVFVEGDLVVKGSFKGQGTIYARNIFIIGDVVASKSPFPFATKEADALVQARNSILRGDDALYFAALNQIWVGEYDTTLGDDFGVVRPSKEGAFAAVGGEQRFLEIAQRPLGPESYMNGTPGAEPWTFTVSEKIRIDVQRVDAFLFANDAIVWRAHGNWLLNGGFITPKAAMTSRMQKETGGFWFAGNLDAPGSIPNFGGLKRAELINPRNMLPSHTNVIRFDYRLRAGGVGFESIRELF